MKNRATFYAGTEEAAEKSIRPKIHPLAAKATTDFAALIGTSELVPCYKATTGEELIALFLVQKA